jgi:hypothetical protein
MAYAPRPPELDPRDLTSFAEAGSLAQRFEETLRQHYGIEIARGSDLESVNLDLLMLEGYRRGEGRPDPMTDIRPMFGRAAGWIDFVRLLLRAHQEGKLHRFLAHLHLLNTARAVAQNERVPMSDEASNKLFELFVALCCSPFSDEVVLDDPHAAKGDNPDVLAAIEGVRWGFACKVLNGASPLTMYERLEEGLDQIQRSPADTGFVFFNLKNLVDHRRAWPLVNEEAYHRRAEEPVYGSWPSPTPVLRQLDEFMNERWTDCQEYNGPENVARLFAGKKSMHGAAVYMATATAFTTSTGPLPSIVGQIGIMRCWEIRPEGEAVLARINDVLHGRR